MGRSLGRGLCTVTAIAQGCRALWEDLWLGLHPGLTSPVRRGRRRPCCCTCPARPLSPGPGESPRTPANNRQIRPHR